MTPMLSDYQEDDPDRPGVTHDTDTCTCELCTAYRGLGARARPAKGEPEEPEETPPSQSRVTVDERDPELAKLSAELTVEGVPRRLLPAFLVARNMSLDRDDGVVNYNGFVRRVQGAYNIRNAKTARAYVEDLATFGLLKYRLFAMGDGVIFGIAWSVDDVNRNLGRRPAGRPKGKV